MNLVNTKFCAYNSIVKKKLNAWDFEKGDPIVNIGAWVLMPNHFHLYITPKTEARLLFFLHAQDNRDDERALGGFLV